VWFKNRVSSRAELPSNDMCLRPTGPATKAFKSVAATVRGNCPFQVPPRTATPTTWWVHFSGTL
jgi:hypothetical protein